MNLLDKTNKYTPFIPAYIKSFNSNFKRKLYGNRSSPEKLSLEGRKGERKNVFSLNNYQIRHAGVNSAVRD